MADTLKGQVPRGFVVLKAGVDRPDEELRAELVAIVRERIGAVASLREVAVVAALPKTRSGKILRKTMRGIADGSDEPVPSTIDDVAVLDALRPVSPAGVTAGSNRAKAALGRIYCSERRFRSVRARCVPLRRPVASVASGRFRPAKPLAWVK